MTWGIVAGLISLAGCLVTLGTVIYKLSKTLTTLEAAITALTEFKSDSKTEHKEFHEKLDDHEKRIHTLEIKAE